MELKLSGGGMTFSGYGAVFGNVDSYGDVIAKGAFARSLRDSRARDRWPAMLLQHGGMLSMAQDMTPVGIWTLLEEDAVGLRVEGKFANTERGRELAELIAMKPRPAITGLSIGYVARELEYGKKPDDPKRKLTRVDLHEVSLVTFPANDSARIAPLPQQSLKVSSGRDLIGSAAAFDRLGESLKHAAWLAGRIASEGASPVSEMHRLMLPSSFQVAGSPPVQLDDALIRQSLDRLLVAMQR